jgi:hypothetical protein
MRCFITRCHALFGVCRRTPQCQLPDSSQETLPPAHRRLLFDIIHDLNAPVFSGQRIGGALELAAAEADRHQLIRRDLELLRQEDFDRFGAALGKRLIVAVVSGRVGVPADEEGGPLEGRTAERTAEPRQRRNGLGTDDRRLNSNVTSISMLGFWLTIFVTLRRSLIVMVRGFF